MTRTNVVETILVVRVRVYLTVTIREQLSGNITTITLGQIFILYVFVAGVSGFYHSLQFIVRAALFRLPLVRKRNDVGLDVPFGSKHIVFLVAGVRSA